MIDDRALIRHLEEGGEALWNRPEPPALDLGAITGAETSRGSARVAPSRRTWTLRPFVAIGGAVACVAIGLFGGAALFGSTAPSPPALASTPATPSAATTPEPLPAQRRQVSLARFGNAVPADAAAQVNVFTATDGRTVDLRVKGLAQPRRGEFYELWVLGNGTKMISLGIVRVDASGSAEVRLPLPVSLRRFPVFDISLEPGDGNPKHSGDSVLRSEAAA